jgi:hypothetical protein
VNAEQPQDGLGELVDDLLVHPVRVVVAELQEAEQDAGDRAESDVGPRALRPGEVGAGDRVRRRAGTRRLLTGGQAGTARLAAG